MRFFTYVYVRVLNTRQWMSLRVLSTPYVYVRKKNASLENSLKLRLHTAINRADFVSWCMLYTYEGNKMHSWENSAVAFVVEPLNHIHQDTKSARLIAVCKRTFKARFKRRSSHAPPNVNELEQRILLNLH